MSMLRPQTTVQCIPHPYHIYRKCFSTLIRHGWAYGCALTLLRLWRAEVDFWDTGVGPSLSDAVMSMLRLQTTVECIPHPYHIYRKCFSTLMCCGCADGCALTLLHLCRAEEALGEMSGLSLCDVVMSMLRPQTTVECIPHPYHIYRKCLSTLTRHGW